MEAPFWKLSVFADGPLLGNPAGVVRLADWPADAEMQALAARLALPQTAFVVPTPGAEADHAIRWFGPTAEVSLCGHATLAAGYVLAGEGGALRFSTRKAGILEVRRQEGATAIGLPRITPVPTPLPAIVAALDVPPPVATLWDARGYAVVVLADEDAVRRVAPDFAALAAIGPISITITAPGEASDIISRVFVPAYGAPEDAVTGSAHAAIAGWWSEKLGLSRLSAVQASPRGGRLSIVVEAARIWLSGGVTTEKTGSFVVRE